jgi:hypothetical protein
MTLVSLLHAWNTFKDDLFNGKLKFSGQWPNEKEHNGSTERYKLTGFSGRDIETIFKRLISTIDVDTTKKVEYLFRNLFDNHLIDQITSRTNLNN